VARPIAATTTTAPAVAQNQVRPTYREYSAVEARIVPAAAAIVRR
jgi:hypothetical protein